MRVGVVARGPRHILLPARRKELDVIIGVNHAAERHLCDWWSFGDYETLSVVTPIGHPNWFTTQNVLNRIVANRQTHPVVQCVWESVEPNFVGHDEAGMGWTVFSATAALVLAKHLGATSIVCFGVIDEEPSGGEAERWRTERRIWNVVCKWCGIPVVRA